MPPTPNDAFDGFLLLLARLWRAKWFIVAFAALFAIVTYLNLKFLADETFRSEAVLYLSPDVQAPTLKTMITSAEVLDVVRTRYRQQFPDAKGTGYLDRFAKRFKASEEINEDNSLRKVYSPALTLTADATTPKEAQALNAIWIDIIVNRYGGMMGLNAKFRTENGRILLNELKKQEKDIVERRTAFQVQVVELESRLQSMLGMLSPVERVDAGNDREFTAYIRGMQPKPQQLSLSVPAAAAAAREPGLIEQQMRLQTDRAKAKARLEFLQEELKRRTESGVAATNPPVGPSILDLRADIAVMEAEEKAIADQIVRVRDEVASLTLALQQAKAELAGADTDLAGIRLQQDFAGSDLAENTADGFLSGQESAWSGGTPSRMDFTVAVSPSLPDRKIAPQRMMSGILAGIVGGFLSCFIVALAHLIELLPKVEPKKGR